MTDPIQTAYDRAQAAIDALAREGRREASEHAYALDQLRAEVERLRAINAGLRERVAELEHRCLHTAEVLAPKPWTPKVGDRVRIAREPFEYGFHHSDWEPDWGKVGDVGTVIGHTDSGNARVDGIGTDGGPWSIDPACLDPVCPQQHSTATGPLSTWCG